MQPTNLQPQYHFQDFILLQQLGRGSFGTVHKAKHSKQSSKPYAIKVETIGAIKPMLHLEYELLSKLKEREEESRSKSQSLVKQKGFSFPQVVMYKQEEYMSYMAMDMLDITLQDFANREMKNVFSKDCLIRIFYNLLKILQSIHTMGYVHRDLKPSNFMLKLNPHSSSQQPQKSYEKYLPTLYPIDLGLCKRYHNPITRQHISCKENKKMVGTAMFCSLNTHKGLEQGRRDDLEAMIYFVAYLVKKLPWESGVTAKEIIDMGRNGRLEPKVLQDQPQSPKKKTQQKLKLDKYEEIYQIKKATNFDEFLNDPQLLPKCILEVYKIVTKMNFEDEPNYAQIYGILEKEHYKLTGLKVQLNQFPCKWQNLTIVKQPQNKNIEEKKKIKINFKIPPNKLKKPITQTAILLSSQNNIQSQDKIQDP